MRRLLVGFVVLPLLFAGCGSGGVCAVVRVAFSAAGRTLVSVNDDETIRLWDLRTLRQIGQLAGLVRPWGAATTVAYNPDGRILAVGGDHETIWLWDVRTDRQLGRPLHLPRRDHAVAAASAITSVAFSPDGRTLASASGPYAGGPYAGGPYDKTIRLWEVHTQQQLGRPLGGQAGSNSLVFSPDGRTLAAGRDDGTVQLFDVRTRRQLGHPLRLSRGDQPLGIVYSVAFSPDGRTIAAGGSLGTSVGVIGLWSVQTQRQLSSPLLDGTVFDRAGAVLSLAFSVGGRTLASASGRTLLSGGGDYAIRLWDLRTRQQVGRALLGHTKDLSGFNFAISPDGRTLASSSNVNNGGDGTIRLWDTRSHRRLGVLSG